MSVEENQTSAVTMAPETVSALRRSVSSSGTGGSSQQPPYVDYFFVIYMVVYVLGILGNGLSLVVWSRSGRRQRRSTPVVYFRAICLADSLVLLMHPLERLRMHQEGMCQVLHVLFLAVQVFAVFLVLGLSTQRFVELVYPLRAKRVVTYRCTVTVILVLAALALCSSVLEAYLWHVNRATNATTTTTTSTTSTITTTTTTGGGGRGGGGEAEGEEGECQCGLRHVWWLRGYTFCVLGTLFLLPLVLVLVLNVAIIRALQRRRSQSRAFSIAMVPDRPKLSLSVTILCCYLAFCEIAFAMVHQYYQHMGHAETGASGSLHMGHTQDAGSLQTVTDDYLFSSSNLSFTNISSSSPFSPSSSLSSSSFSNGTAAATKEWGEGGGGSGRGRVSVTGSWHRLRLASLPLLVLDVVALTSYAVDVAVFTLCSKTFRRQVRQLCVSLSRCRRRLRRPSLRSTSVFYVNGHNSVGSNNV